MLFLLLYEYTLHGPVSFCLTNPRKKNRYYAQEMLTLLQRTIAIIEWAKLRIGEPVSLERALGAFDLFIPVQKQEGLDEVGKMHEWYIHCF